MQQHVCSAEVQAPECFRAHEDTDLIKNIVMWIAWSHLAVG